MPFMEVTRGIVRWMQKLAQERIVCLDARQYGSVRQVIDLKALQQRIVRQIVLITGLRLLLVGAS